ncbi:ribulokinase [candidate division KSB3 bacterium]|uniref:Ribulokinase n=1 Tax=candidate division KSB3 bacterium TaxID=2044937 RepID=A0A9D5JTR3_9BACT|nr:ribulokinase [candidate division KSB3 bacterium]MBD3323841.1 ribulokinase [candidate division KSB3 bacterium]
MGHQQYVIGMDFGTDSVRVVIVNVETGKEEATAVSYYPRWSKGAYCDPAKNQFRQHALDYIESMEASVKDALAKLPGEVATQIVGIGIDTTGSTPGPVDESGTPLALRDEFAENPNAMFVLWKDHTAVKEAEEINRVARTWGGTDFTKYEGGVYSSEWFWAKILHILRVDAQVREAAFSWMEHCDWMAALLTGNRDPRTLKRSRCAAGHKAMWHESWGGLPDEAFLVKVDPLLEGLKARLYTETYTSDVKVGGLTEEWASRLGLQPGIAVAVGAFDAHMGAVGAGIQKKTLSKIMGTSTCDMLVAPYDVIGTNLVAGICGQVDGSVIPGMIGLEAGQSAYGDVYAWFKNLLSWPLETLLPETSLVAKETAETLREEIQDKILIKLAEEAAQIPVEETGLLALDWLNGRRTPFADQTLKGAILGVTLGTSAAKIFRALAEATAFGARAINEQFIQSGVEIEEVIATGGIAQRSEFVMQVTADVLNMPIKVVASEQAVALGAAMFGAIAAGIYASTLEAQEKMGSGFSKTYMPDAANAAKYDALYAKYQEIGKLLEDHLRHL